MHPQSLPALTYFLSAAVAIVAAVRTMGILRRLGMGLAAIGFVILGFGEIVSPADNPGRPLVMVAGGFLIAGILGYWVSHFRG